MDSPYHTDPLDPTAVRLVIEPRVQLGGLPAIPGAIARPCACCGAAVWASPSSVAVLRPQDYLICVQCGAEVWRVLDPAVRYQIPVGVPPGWGRDIEAARLARAS